MSANYPKQETARIESLLKTTLEGSAKPSGVVDHKIDERGLELKLFIPREKLSRAATRELLSLLMSDMM